MARLYLWTARRIPNCFGLFAAAGGNFGVVTSLLVRLHPIEKVLAGFILFPLAEAMSVLTGYCKFASSAPEELSVIGGIVSAPDGKPCVLLAGVEAR
jgi:FAD/FMN-containing dehydrogenase